MKRAISMLIAIVMVLSLVPTAFAASETATVLEDISEFNVELNADNGYYAEYSWTPAEDGNLSLYQYTDKEIEMMLTQGENNATSYFEDADGAYYGFSVSLDVVAGEEVIIEVLNANEADEVFAVSGTFLGVPGKHEDNPIYLDGTENIVTNSGTVYYAGYYAGAQMYITGNGEFSVTFNGETLTAENGVVTFAAVNMNTLFAVTGEGEFIIKAEYPVGSQMNPEALFRPAYIAVNIAEGNDQGYYYKWQSQEKGTLTLTCPTVEGVGYDVIMTNMTTYAQSWLSDSTDGTVSINVAPGQEVQIQITVEADENWNYPALQTAFTGAFVMNDFGAFGNPEILAELAWTYSTVSQEEGDNDGYFYSYTATADGVVTLYFTEVPYAVIEDATYDEEGWELTPAVTKNYVADITVTNTTTYAQYSLLQDGVDNFGLELQIPVKAGEELQINTVLLEDTEGNMFPAGDYTWCGNFAYPAGTEQNPISIEWNWDDTYTNATATVTVPAGETLYYSGTNGMILTVNGTETAMDMEGKFTITNEGETEATYELAMATAVGAQSNPEVIGVPFEDTNSLEADASYYYIYTANTDVELVLDITDGANITADLLTYVEDSEWPISEQFALAEPTVDENWSYTGWNVAENLTISMTAGQELKIQVTGLTDWATWSTPAVDYTLTVDVPAGSAANPIDLTTDLLYEDDFSATVTVAAGKTVYYMAYRVNGMIMSINGAEQGLCTTAGMMMPYTWSITNEGETEATYVITVAAPVGTMDNPEILFRPSYINVNIPEGNTQGYFYKWTANADGELKLTCPTVEGVNYDVNMTNMSTYAQAWLIDSTDGTITLAVKAGDEIIIQVCAMPDAAWNTPALSVALTGEFIFPIGHQMNPEILFRPSYINVNIPEGNTQGYFYKWTANADGELKLTCPAVEGVNYDVNMTNMSTYAQAWLIDSTDGTITLAVKAGDEIIIQVCAMPDAAWNTPALSVALTGEFIFPVGHQMNPEILFRPSYINVNIPEGNTQGYFYKWTANADGELTLTCPAVEGVNYDVNMTNMSTYAQAWLIDSTDGTITLAVKRGDEIVIQVCALPDAAWNTPALSVALTGEFTYPVGTQMNPEALTSVEQIHVSIAEGNNQGYFYKWTATANGELTLTCPAVEGVNYDVNMTNMRTYAQAWLVDSTDGTITLAVEAGDEVVIQVCAMPDASWNTPALNVTLTGGKAAAITAQPQAVTANSGDTVQFKVETTGEVVSYKWEYRKIYKWFATEMEGYNTDTLNVKVTGARNGYDYRCTVTFADGTVLVTEPAELTVNSTIVITGNPNNQAVALGYKGQFTAAAEGDGIQYAWQYSRNGETWAYTQMEGYTKPTVMIETTAARDGYMYRCEIKDATGAVAYTEVATLTVLHYTTQPADVRTEAGATVTFSVETNAPVVRYEWQYSKDGEKWTTTSMTGYNTATLTVEATAARDGYQYRCVITGAKDSKAYSKAATLYIGAPAVITAQPESTTAEAGATVTFSVEATNVLTYQWQYTKDGINWYTTSMTGATTDTLEVAVTASRNGYQYRCQITGTDGEVVYTNAATLTVG